MAINIPTTYGALDDDAFVEGAPVSAKHMAALVNAANHLTGSSAAMFSMWFPNGVYSVGDDLTPRSYDFTAGSFWKMLLPPIHVRKKPGATLGEFRLDLFQYGGSIKLQVNTLANPFRRAPPSGWPGVVDLPALTDSEVLGTMVNNVPLKPTPYEVVEIWASSLSTGAAAVDFLGGSSATANVLSYHSGGSLYCFIDGADVNWEYTSYNDRKGDFATNRYVASLFDGQGNPAGVFRIKAVLEGPTGPGGFDTKGLWLETSSDNIRGVQGIDLISDELAGRINDANSIGAPFTVTISIGASLSLNSFAGRTLARTI